MVIWLMGFGRTACLRAGFVLLLCSVICAHLYVFSFITTTKMSKTVYGLLVPFGRHARMYGEKVVPVELKRNVTKYNVMQTVYNEETFGVNHSYVIAVQVHDRINYLRFLIRSLEAAEGISDALVIFSHDYYDDNINDLVQNIRFCKVMQIFYPFSLQLYPDKFPGEDPNDCPRDVDIEKATQMRCNNADSPDFYGHYREVKYTQIKHHWWWKANKVFDNLFVTENYEGPVLFLEEDHYVSKDFLHILKLLQTTSKAKCPECTVLSLGAYVETYETGIVHSNSVEIVPWYSFMNIAFDRAQWNVITNCKETFCTYDDYNWDWSLQYTSQECLKKKLVAMRMLKSRIFHIGTCGLHHHSTCNASDTVQKIEQNLKADKKFLFPKALKILHRNHRAVEIVRSNGGWGDTRDHRLCTGNLTIK